jgi:MFS family permease
VTGASILLPFMSSFLLVAGSQAAADAATSFFGPAIVAITLGIMGPTRLRSVLIFCLCCVIFHLANAAMLPLVGQKLALQDENEGTALMSGCIVAAQVVMVPMAALVGANADIRGRKPLFLAGLAILSLRCFLYPLLNDRLWLFAVQSLDGVGAGLYGALFPLIVADLTRGTGHFNLAQGAVITAQGIGAALSTSLAGLIVVHAGFSAAFLVLAAIAGFGFLLYSETCDIVTPGPNKTAAGVQIQ